MPDTVRNVTVVFTDSTRVMTKPLDSDFRHCLMVCEMDTGNYVYINPAGNGIDIKVLTYLEYRDMLKNLFDNNLIFVLAKPKPMGTKMNFPNVYSCVEVVKRTLGIDKPFIITPKQLYKHLTEVDCEYHETYF